MRRQLTVYSGPASSSALGADAPQFVVIYRFRRYFMDKLIERRLLRAGPLLDLSSQEAAKVLANAIRKDLPGVLFDRFR